MGTHTPLVTGVIQRVRQSLKLFAAYAGLAISSCLAGLIRACLPVTVTLDSCKYPLPVILWLFNGYVRMIALAGKAGFRAMAGTCSRLGFVVEGHQLTPPA
jgi:hypothetical protein